MKRKRDEKRSERSEHGAALSQESTQDVVSSILILENGILESRKNYNDILQLLDLTTEQNISDGRETAAAVALYRVFCKLMAMGTLSKNLRASEDESTIVQWLRERLQEYEKALLKLLQSKDGSKKVAALTLSMRLIKEKARHLNATEHDSWDKRLFQKLVQALVETENDTGAVDEFVDKYVAKYADIRCEAFISISYEVARAIPIIAVLTVGSDIESSDHTKLENILHILSSIEPVIKEAAAEDFFITLHSKHKSKMYALTSQKKQAQKAWMSVLRQQLNKAQRKKILELISHGIAPWFLQVELLMDFLTDAFNVGGSTSLMALSGLFHLMQQKNLDYPQFYTKLYSMLNGSVLHSKHRSRFFRLLDTFLASTHLPAALVASFIKKLSRLALFSPPSAIVVVVPFIYNILQNHRSCTFMIHRTTDSLDRSPDGWGDPFIADEPDPMETDAIESSLWEIYTLQSHHHPNVAAIAKIISEPFTKAKYNLEDFLDHSYATMLDAELSKNMKKAPEIEYEIPKKIFTSYDADSGKEDSLLVKLWNFE